MHGWYIHNNASRGEDIKIIYELEKKKKKKKKMMIMMSCLCTRWCLSMALVIISCLILLNTPWTADSANPLSPYELSMKSYINSHMFCRSFS